MTIGIIKPKSTEVALSSANNVSNATLVRILNNNSAVTVLTVAYANGTTYANCTLAGFSETFLRKKPTDTVAATNGLAISIAFQD